MQQPPFHNSNRDPLPDASDIEAEFQGKSTHWHQDDPAFEISAEGRSRLEADKRWLRNFIVGLLLAGFAVGGVLAIGLVWGMNRLDLIDPPTITTPESAE
ncbi:MAG: hypothetical protein F6K00_03705 [Leptolyngbya sp. SIOISBB]|nr:hypothetical protein [Leptolyngbya sp. SIOISBB]